MHRGGEKPQNPLIWNFSQAFKNSQTNSLSDIKRFEVLIDLDKKYSLIREKYNEKYNLKYLHERRKL